MSAATSRSFTPNSHFLSNVEHPAKASRRRSGVASEVSGYELKVMASARHCLLLRNLSNEERRELARLAVARDYRRRELIFSEGSPARFVYLVASGRVNATQVSGSGKEIIISVRTRGDVIDGFGMTTERVHSVTARAVDTCRVLALDVNRFEAIANGSAALRQNAISILSDRVRSLQRRLLCMGTGSVPQRVARTLIELHGHDHENAQLDFSCEELAQMAGTTMFAVSRLLCHWAGRGIIQPDRRRVIVDNLAALVEIAEGTTKCSVERQEPAGEPAIAALQQDAKADDTDLPH